MSLFAKPASPRIVWRNPAMPHGTRRASYRDTVREGKEYEVLEKACGGDWLVVTVLTVVAVRRSQRRSLGVLPGPVDQSAG